ncbi:MAG: pseudouridine synthase [bacterium]|jgi:23S rRNA pseudouridine2604 synthase|nr:pseudouridine synthase [bacterium]
MSDGIRINKYLSTHGYCSRREADRLVKQGKVFINDQPADLGDLVEPEDDVRVQGRDKKKEPKKVYILVNKPVGVICTTDPRSPDNIIDFVGYPERIFPVGRLDVQSEGLIILTNDGVLTNRLLHPRYEHEKEYVVTVDQSMPRRDISKLQSGVELLDGMTLPAKVRQLTPNKFAIILREGRNRQIRRMCDAIGYEVLNLKRTRMGTLKIQVHYPSGNWRHLTEKEVYDLKKMVGLKARPPAPPRKKRKPRSKKR